MMSLPSLLTTLLKACLVVLLLLVARGLAWLFNLFLLAPLFDPLRKMQGPDAPPFHSHFQDLMQFVSCHVLTYN